MVKQVSPSFMALAGSPIMPCTSSNWMAGCELVKCGTSATSVADQFTFAAPIPQAGQLQFSAASYLVNEPEGRDDDASREFGAGEPVLAVRCVWTVGGEPGALSASYLPERLATRLGLGR